jgi:hypothetical protein
MGQQVSSQAESAGCAVSGSEATKKSGPLSLAPHLGEYMQRTNTILHQMHLPHGFGVCTAP